MSLLRPAASRAISARQFSTTNPNRASLMFALSALSNQQETQHFAQRSRLNRVEHSPALELIRESEVKPFKRQETNQTPIREPTKINNGPTQAEASTIDSYTSALPTAPILQTTTHSPSNANPSVEAAMLQTLQQMSTQLSNLEARLLEMGIETEKDVRRTGALVTVLVAGAVAGLGIWNFWPPKSVRGEFKRKHVSERHVQERSRVIPADVVGHHHAGLSPAAAMGEPAVFAAGQAAVPATVVEPVAAALKGDGQTGSWWRSVFWKKD